MKRQGMRGPGIFCVVAGVVVALVLGAVTARSAQAATEPFKKAELFFEWNSTEGNIGIQAFFDADNWIEVEIRNPKGHVIFETEADRSLKRIGVAELRFESVEPEFDPTDPEPDFFKKFREGLYTFKGRTGDGGKLKSTVMLSHALPSPPVIDPVGTIFPVIAWSWSQNGGPALTGFQVIVEIVGFVNGNEVTLRSLTVDLPPSATSLAIAPEFLPALPDPTVMVVKFEVLAMGVNGNRTITQDELPLLP